MLGGEGADVAVQAIFAGEDFEGLGDLLGRLALAAAAIWVRGLVELSAAGLADEGFDFSGAVGVDVMRCSQSRNRSLS